LGCGRRQDQSILAEFLVEAVMLSLVGGMVGLLLGRCGKHNDLLFRQLTDSG
jgi:hypothetical protein